MSANSNRPGMSSLRAAVYARYSTDLQNERSIEDQFTLCREYSARESLTIVETYEDAAISSGSILGRDGLISLLADARNHRFEVVVVESLDRLSRDMEDLAGIHKRLTFAGIEIRGVHEGKVNTVLVGLRGLVGQLYREDNAHKVRRGLAGRVKEGRIPGGLTYGYAAVAGHEGQRTIMEDEAAIVRRIFNEYTIGRTPREIAHGLNRDAVSAPRGSTWNASTIHGNCERRSGILHNELYAGRLVWNRVRMIKDPDTGKRVSRINPESEWHRADVPELALVPAELFDAAHVRKESRRVSHPSHQRRPKHLLSGLLRCGACGASMVSKGKDKSGRTRVHCSAGAESNTCPDPTSFYLETIELAVVSGMREQLQHPAVITEYVRTYTEERRRLAIDMTSGRDRLEKQLASVCREADKITDFLVKGIGDVARLDGRSKELMAEEKSLRAELSRVPAAPTVLTLHPAVLLRHERQLERLSASLGGTIRAGDEEAAESIRDLVKDVTVYRRGLGAMEVEVTGRLNALLGEKAFPGRIRMVGGNGGSTPLLPALPPLGDVRFSYRASA